MSVVFEDERLITTEYGEVQQSGMVGWFIKTTNGTVTKKGANAFFCSFSLLLIIGSFMIYQSAYGSESSTHRYQHSPLEKRVR